MEQHWRVEELRGRIRDSARFHGEPLPREMALAWHGYLAAALEWGLISVAQHEELTGMLPEPPGDFIDTLFLGREEDGGLRGRGRSGATGDGRRVRRVHRGDRSPHPRPPGAPLTPTAFRRTAAACLLTALLACSGDPTGPTGLQGTYRLVTVGSTPVPALADEGMYGSITVLSASLRFQGDSVRLDRTERWVERGPDGQVMRTQDRVRSETYPFTVQGARLQIGQPCSIDPATLCAYSETGGVEGARLSMRVWYSRHEWTYERVRD